MYLDTEGQIDPVSLVGSYCRGVMGLQACRGWAVLGEVGLGNVPEESDWRDEEFVSLLKLAHLERNELKDPFLKI